MYSEWVIIAREALGVDLNYPMLIKLSHDINRK